VDEHEWHVSQAADSLKSSSAESGRSQVTVQEITRSEIVNKASTAQAQAGLRGADVTDKQWSTSVMDQIVDKASLRSIGGRSEIQIRLKPDFLGNVQMNIATDRDQLVVRVMTDQVVVKDIIETHLHQLKAEHHNQGLTIDKFDVMVNPDADNQQQREQFAQLFKQPSSQQGRRQAREQGQENPQEEGGHLAADDDQPEGNGISYFA
jgi:flagellar hook-length control protein FliK